MQLRLLALCVLCAGASENARSASVLEKAQNAISQLEKHCKSAKALAGNETEIAAFEADLKSAAIKVDLSLKTRRTKLADKYQTVTHKAHTAALHANSVNGTANITAALEKADAALTALRNVSNELKSLDREQLYQLAKALKAVGENATRVAHNAARRAERIADVVTDPLYGMGDSMEDKADKLNDQRTDLASCASDALDKVDSQIKDRAEDIEHKTSESLQQDADRRHDTETHLKTLAERAAARSASLEAALSARDQHQNFGASLVPMALTAVIASGCTAFLFKRSQATSSMRNPLLPH